MGSIHPPPPPNEDDPELYVPAGAARTLLAIVAKNPQALLEVA